jgi:GT2 family glycosyltransferase/glycosyltransferase involved in cell wall biosynthesis
MGSDLPQNCLVSIIIVSYNAKAYLRSCLDSIFKAHIQLDFEVIVVDNNSSDGSIEMVKELFPQVILFKNKENVGFSSANNVGMRHCRGRYIFLLNSDSEIYNRTLEELVSFMEQTPEAGAVAPKLINTDGSLQPSANLSFPGLGTFLLDKLVFRFKFQIFFLTHRYFKSYFLKKNSQKFNRARKVAWVGWAAVLLRREAIFEIGLMDENYFLYLEDLDCCKQLVNAGWTVYYLPQVEVTHHWSKSVGQEVNLAFCALQESIKIYLQKHAGSFPVLAIRISMLVELFLRLILLIPLMIFTPRRKDYLIKVPLFMRCFESAFSKVKYSHSPEKKIAIDAKALSEFTGGIGAYVAALLKGLNADNELSIEVVTNKRLKKDFVTARFKQHVIPNSSSQVLWTHWYLRRRLKRIKPDLFHATDPFNLPIICPCRSITTIQDVRPLLLDRFFASLWEKIYYYTTHFLAAHFSEEIICPSQYSKQTLLRYFKIPPDKIKIIYHGIESEKYRDVLQNTEIEGVAGRTSKNYVICLGPLVELKNQLNALLGVFKFNQRHGENLEIFQTGAKTAYRQTIREKAEEIQMDDKLTFLGHLSFQQLVALIANARALLFLSLEEGFGYPALESMACGTPLIASNRSCLPEIVKSGGILVDPQNPDEVAAALEQIFYDEDYKKSLIERGYQTVAQYSCQRSIQEHINLFNEMML